MTVTPADILRTARSEMMQARAHYALTTRRLEACVKYAHESGMTYTEIGRVLKITRQRAAQLGIADD